MSDDMTPQLENLAAAETRRDKLRKAKDAASAAMAMAQKVWTEIMLAESDAIDEVLAARSAAGLVNVRNAVLVNPTARSPVVDAGLPTESGGEE